MYRIAIDAGGTFTDLVAVSDEGAVYEAKVPSSRAHPEAALESGLRELAARAEFDRLEDLLGATRILIQGTTVAINAVLQGTGARTGLLCTRGFRDALEIRLGYKEERYRFAYVPPSALVPRHLRIPITERVDKAGSVRVALVDDEVEAAAHELLAEGVESVAICFLWSFRYPEHERRAERIVRSVMPRAYVSSSVDVLPRIREYDRVSTTVLNAYVGPLVERYIGRTEDGLGRLGFRGRVRYVQSNGGLAESAEVARRPVLLLLSGPAAGPAAGRQFAGLSGASFIVIDMGGTSFDTCLVRDGLPDMRASSDFDGRRAAMPLVDLHTIGAGGGSIATVDHGLLRVGPESAEADPGPACYQRGGTWATVTDANVVAGLLNQENLLGGRFPIDARLAARAIETSVAGPLAMGVGEAAAGVVEVALRNMADAIREITVRRGHDPRDYSLTVGGGAGGLHAVQLAEELGITRVVVPRVASAFCAFGAAVADLRHDYTRSYADDTRQIDFGRVGASLDELEAQGRRALHDEGTDEASMSFIRVLEIRYKDQVYECAVDVSGIDFNGDRETVRAAIEERFHARHQALYDYSQPGYPCEVISMTVTALGLSAPVRLSSASQCSVAVRCEPVAVRSVSFRRTSEPVRTPVYAGEAFVADTTLCGPLVIEEPHTTIAVPPGWRLIFHAAEQAYVLTPDASAGAGV